MLAYLPLLLMSHSHNVFVCDDAAIYARPCFTRNQKKKRWTTAIYACLNAAPSARDVLTHKLVPPIHAPDATYPNALAVIAFLGQVHSIQSTFAPNPLLFVIHVKAFSFLMHLPRIRMLGLPPSSLSPPRSPPSALHRHRSLVAVDLALLWGSYRQYNSL